MSTLGTFTVTNPTGLRDFLQRTYSADSPVPALFALDINVKPDIDAVSPTTKLIFRTQQFGADNGNMYNGDPIAAGRARVDQCISVLRQNPADFYALDNEPGRSDVDGLNWLCNYNLGEMQRADELGIKLCVGNWSTGMPPISAAESAKIAAWMAARLNDSFTYGMTRLKAVHESIAYSAKLLTTIDYPAIYTPMLRYAMANDHALAVHEYSLSGTMIGSPLCLRYRALYDALPDDARPDLYITEAGPGAGYGTVYTMQPYISVVAEYDDRVMDDIVNRRYPVVGVNLFKLGKGESNMAEAMPLLTQYVIDHPTPAPVDPPPPPEPPPVALTEHRFMDIVTQSDDAADALQAVIDEYGLATLHYTRTL